MKQILFLLAVLLFAGCSVQQRRYQRGLYVNWFHHAKQLRTPALSDGILTREESNPAIHVNKNVLSASADAGISLQDLQSGTKKIKLLSSKRKKSIEPDTCDLLIMRNGNEMRVHLLEISPTELRYNKCETGSSAVYVSRRSDVFMIKYANGTKETFREEEAPRTKQVENVTKRKEHPEAMTVLILAILGWVIGIGSIPAIIIGNRVLREIRANPEKYSGEETVNIAVIISWVKVALIILALIFVLLLIASI